MKLIDPQFEELSSEGINPLILGERCIRVCYKSEDKIEEGSAVKLIRGIIRAGHTAMLEHIPVYFKIEKDKAEKIVFMHKEERLEDDFDEDYYNQQSKLLQGLFSSRFANNLFTTDFIYTSTNLRVLYEIDPEYVDEFIDNNGERYTLKDIPYIHSCRWEDARYSFFKRITILFTMDRIGSQSFCRHRLFSFAQESTRWCNYLKEKFGSEISIINPCWLKEGDEEEFKKDMEELEKLYFKWINKGYKAEEARAFLPFGLKTEIIMTGFEDTWRGFLDLRDEQHAHSQARELATPLKEYLMEKKYLYYGDKIEIKEEIKYEL